MPEEFGATAGQQLIVVDSEGYENIFTINLCSLELRNSCVAVLGQIYSVTVEVVSTLIAPEHNEKESQRSSLHVVAAGLCCTAVLHFQFASP